MFFSRLFDARGAAFVLIAGLLTIYVALPLVVDSMFLPNPYFVQLAMLSIVGCATIALGYRLPLFDHRFKPGAARITLSAQAVHAFVWSSFVVYLLITFTTADSIPIISAIKGASAADLSLQRGGFLKTHVGFEALPINFNTLFVSALLPYGPAAPCRVSPLPFGEPQDVATASGAGIDTECEFFGAPYLPTREVAH